MASEIKVDTVSEKTSANGVSIDSVKLKDGTVDVNGASDGLILDADADTTISADTDDQIDIKIAGADDFKFTANTFTANSGSSIVVPDGGLTFGSTAIASTAAELNILDGVTSTAAELNIMDGVTSTTAELNILDGVTSTAAELNIVDGNTSATSTTIADADRVVLNDNGTMVQAAVTDLKTYIGGGGLVKIASGSASAGDADVTLTSCFSSTYKIYKIFFYNWNGSADAQPLLQWYAAGSLHGGGSDYQYAGVGFNTSGQGSSWSGSTSSFRLTGETLRHDSDEHFGFEGTLYDPAGTSLKKRFVMAGGGRRTSNYGFNGHGTGEWNDLRAITGFKVFQSTGTFDSLSYAVYGLVN